MPREISPGIYAVIETSPRGHIDTGAVVRVEETDTGLRFSDETGATIAVLTGADLGLVEIWAEYGDVSAQGLAVVEAGRASTSAVPGRSSGYTGYPDMVILGTEAGFTAFRLARGGTFRAWHSGDGRAWTEGPLIGTREGEPQQVENLYRVSWPTPTVHASTVHGIDEMAWETTDGVSWTAVPRVVPGGGYYDMHPLLTGGWLWLDGNNGDVRVSADGESWERVSGIESLTKWQTEGTDRFGSGTVVGDTLFWSVHDVEAPQRHDLWVIEFDSAAAANATP